MNSYLKDSSTRITLVILTIGVWGIFLQNLGIIPIQKVVYVDGGSIDAFVSGAVDIDNSVNVNGSLDVNLEAINGRRDAFYDFGGNNEFYRIPVYTGY